VSVHGILRPRAMCAVQSLLVNSGPAKPSARQIYGFTAYASNVFPQTRTHPSERVPLLLSVRRVLESYESSVIQEWWSAQHSFPGQSGNPASLARHRHTIHFVDKQCIWVESIADYRGLIALRLSVASDPIPDTRASCSGAAAHS
jgi:hypothetical protein